MKVVLLHFVKEKDQLAYAKEIKKRIKKELTEVVLKIQNTDAKTEQEICSKIQKNAYIIALDENGEDMKTSGITKLVDQVQTNGKLPVFVIGSPTGIPQSVKNKADKVLRFGAATWTYALCHAMAVEQIYRVSENLKGSKYHKK
jgi:23S rRNA (pseudouridine1915-N3)-methyltransferase